MKLFGCFLDLFSILNVHMKLNLYCCQHFEAVQFNFESKLKLLFRSC